MYVFTLHYDYMWYDYDMYFYVILNSSLSATHVSAEGSFNLLIYYGCTSWGAIYFDSSTTGDDDSIEAGPVTYSEEISAGASSIDKVGPATATATATLESFTEESQTMSASKSSAVLCIRLDFLVVSPSYSDLDIWLALGVGLFAACLEGSTAKAIADIPIASPRCTSHMYIKKREFISELEESWQRSTNNVL